MLTANPIFLPALGVPAFVAVRERSADEAFDHARLVGQNPFEAHDASLLGQSFLACIDNRLKVSPDAAARFESFLEKAQEAQASGRYVDAFYAYEDAMAIPHPRRPIARYLYAAAILRDGRARDQAERVLTLARDLEQDLASRPQPPLGKALQAFVDQLLFEVLTVLDRLDEAEPYHYRGLERLRTLYSPLGEKSDFDFFSSLMSGAVSGEPHPSLTPDQREGGRALLEMADIAMRAGLWAEYFYEEAGQGGAMVFIAGPLFHYFNDAKNDRACAKICFEIGFANHAGGRFDTALGLYEKALGFLKNAGDETPQAFGSRYEPSHWSPFLRILVDLCRLALGQDESQAMSDQAFVAEVKVMLASSRRGFNARMAVDMAIFLGRSLMYGDCLDAACDALVCGMSLLLSAITEDEARRGGSVFGLSRSSFLSHGFGWVEKKMASRNVSEAEKHSREALRNFYNALAAQIHLAAVASPKNPAFETLRELVVQATTPIDSKSMDLSKVRMSIAEARDLLRRSFPESSGFEDRLLVKDILAQIAELEAIGAPRRN